MQEYKTDKDKMKFYKGTKWRKLRQQVLEEQNYECQECKENGRVTLANPDKHKSLDIDHIKELSTHPELAYEITNLRVLCIRCHNAKHDRWQKKKENPWINDERW